jgi:hypothetical protein
MCWKNNSLNASSVKNKRPAGSKDAFTELKISNNAKHAEI